MAEDDLECTCPDQADLHKLLSFVSVQPDAFFGNEQRGALTLTLGQKSMYAHNVLHTSKEKFITQYGQFLTPNFLSYFTQNYDGDNNFMYLVKLVQKETRKQTQRVKNRRFTAMKDLLADGEYFCDEQMKSRDPLLYEQMVGQYLTDDEIKIQSDNLLRAHGGFSSMLLEQIDARGNGELYNRQMSAQEMAMEEGDSDSDESELEDNDGPTPGEKMALREEFLHTMQERFLSGQDKEFDYSTVDENTKYDDITQETRDAEDEYFDGTSDEGADESQAEVTESSLAPDEYDY